MANNNETTTKFKVDITELKSAIQEAKRQIRIANSEFKSVSSSMQNWEKTTDGVKAKLKQLDGNLVNQKNILKSLESQYDLTAKQMGKDSAAAENLQISINNQKAVINKTENQIKYYNASLLTAETAEKIAAQTGKDAAKVFDQLSQEAKKAGDSVKGTSDGFAVIKEALASIIGDLGQKAINSIMDLGKQSIMTAMAFGQSMSEVRAIAGATVESYQQLENKARECGERTVFSANESAQALNLAAASSMNLTSASELATNTMQAFGMTIDGATEKLSNGLVCAQNNCSITTNQLGQAYINSAFNINSAGQAIETTTFLLAMMESQGLKGVELGSALNAIFIGMTARIQGMRETICSAAISVLDANGNFQNMMDIFKNVGQIMDPNGNFQNMRDILKDVVQITKEMKDAEEAVKFLSELAKDVIGDLSNLVKEGIENWPKIIEFIKNWTNVTKLQELAQKALDFVMKHSQIGIIITIIGLLIAAFVDLWNNNEDFRNFWIDLWESISKTVGDAIGAIVDFFVKTIPETFNGVIDWIKENWVHILEFLLCPFVGLFHYFYDHCDEFRKFVDNAVNFIKELPGKIWTWLSQTIE